MTQSDIVLQTDSLTKRFGERTAVDNVSLRIRRGEIYGFLGANGAGKTTAMKMMLGLVRPTSGTVTIFGKAPGTPECLKEIGAMVETPAFYPHLSGKENLSYLAKLSDTPQHRVNTVLDQVGLLDRARDRFGAYSLGMKQRLGVAAALLKEPGLLILDEPTNGLDSAGMLQMRGLIRDLGDAGHTIIISSHLMPEVEQIADRVGIIAEGRIVLESTIDDLRGQDQLIIQPDPIDEALTILSQQPMVQHVERQQDSLVLTVDGDRAISAANLNARLVRDGIEVRELRWNRPSLESIFLSVTNATDTIVA